jgi:ABC-type molybdate transport system substrate-binding protein
MSGLALEVAVNRWIKPKFEADTGLQLAIDWRPTAAIMRSIEEGKRADVIIAINDSMDKLVQLEL